MNRDYEGVECYADNPSTRIQSTRRRWNNTAADVERDMDSSTMRYVTVEPQIYRTNRPQRTEQRMIESYRRPHTHEDREINTRNVRPIKPVAPPVRAPRQVNKPASNFWVKAGIGLLCAVAIVEGITAIGSFVSSEFRQLGNEISEGQTPSTELLVGGHAGNYDLHAFIRADRKIQLDEISAKAGSQIHFFVTNPIPFNGPLNQVVLSLQSKEVDGKIEVVLVAQYGGVGVREMVVQQQWLFIEDTTKGYFVGIQAAQ